MHDAQLRAVYDVRNPRAGTRRRDGVTLAHFVVVPARVGQIGVGDYETADSADECRLQSRVVTEGRTAKGLYGLQLVSRKAVGDIFDKVVHEKLQDITIRNYGNKRGVMTLRIHGTKLRGRPIERRTSANRQTSNSNKP